MLTFANVLGARRRRWILPAVLGICILLVLSMVGLWLCAPIPEGTQAGGLNLSGMWAMDAGSALKEALGQTLYAQPLTVQLPEETLTLVPIDHRLIDERLLMEEEKEWLYEYHQNVYKRISPYLNEAEQEWLKTETAFERQNR